MVEVHQEHVLVLNLEGHLGPPLWSSSYSVIVKDKPIYGHKSYTYLTKEHAGF